MVTLAFIFLKSDVLLLDFRNKQAKIQTHTHIHTLTHTHTHRKREGCFEVLSETVHVYINVT